MQYKLTLDGGMMREYVLAPAVATLRAWQLEGKIEIFETDRADAPANKNIGWPGAQRDSSDKSAWGGKRRSPPKRDPKAAAKFGQIAAVIFPMRDIHKLRMSELNDVNYLLRHLSMDRTIFVTRNAASFIENGKREKILKVLQISIMTPEEVVAHLSKEQGWPIKPQT